MTLHKLTSFAAVLPLMLTLACVDDVGEGKVTAEAATNITTTETAAARTVPVNTAASEVRALGAKITATHPIVFDDWSGALKVDGDTLVGVDVTIQMASLRADVDDLTKHLKSEDFFGVDAFPTATFTSSSVVPEAGADGATHKVSGALTMHGETKNVSFPATVSTAGGRITADTEFVIDRRDFGIVYPGMPDDLIQHNVVLTIKLVGEGA